MNKFKAFVIATAGALIMNTAPALSQTHNTELLRRDNAVQVDSTRLASLLRDSAALSGGKAKNSELEEALIFMIIGAIGGALMTYKPKKNSTES